MHNIYVNINKMIHIIEVMLTKYYLRNLNKKQKKVTYRNRTQLSNLKTVIIGNNEMY